MEEFLNRLDYNSVDFYILYVDEYRSQLDDLINEYESSPDTQKLFKYIEIHLSNIDKAVSNFKGNYQQLSECEAGYTHILNTLFRQLKETFDLKDHIDRLLDLFLLLTKFKVHCSFVFSTFYDFFAEFLPDDNIIALKPDKLAKLFDIFKLELKIEYKREPEKVTEEFIEFDNYYDCEDEEICANNKMNNQICHLWDTCMTKFIKALREEDFKKNIHLIQSFYEWCVMNHTYKHQYCPYRHIAMSINRELSYFKSLPIKSIYYELSSEPDRMKNILVIIRKTLIDDRNYYCPTVLSELIDQLRLAIEYNHPKNGLKLFSIYHKEIYEVIFDVFIKADRNDSRYIIRKFIEKFDELMTKSKLPDGKKFFVWILNKLTEIACYLGENYEKIQSLMVNKVSSNTKNTNCIAIFGRLCDEFYSYYDKQVKDIKLFNKPCLDYAASLLNLPIDSGCLSVVRYLFRKEQFFLITNYPEETSLILKRFIKNINLIDQFDDSDNKALRELNGGCENFYTILKQFDDVIIALQPTLFEELVYKPIVTNITEDSFYDKIEYLFKMFSFDSFPADDDELNMKKLDEVLDACLSDEIFDSIQPEEAELDSPRVKYYDRFYEKLFNSLKNRPNLANHVFTEKFVELIKKCDEKDNFINPFTKGSTINFELFNNLARVVFSDNRITNVDLIDKLIETCFSLIDKNNEMMTSDLTSILCEASRFQKESLAKYAEKLWSIYFNFQNKDKRKIIDALSEIVALSSDVLMDKYAGKLAKLALEAKEISYHYSLLLNIVNCAPEFFLQPLDNTELFATSLIKKGKDSKNEIELRLAAGLLYVFGMNILKLKEVPDNIGNITFENRKKFWRVIFKDDKPSNKNLLIIPFYEFDLMLTVVESVYLFLFNCENEFMNDTKREILMDELFEIYDLISTKKCIGLFNCMKKMALMNNEKHKPILIKKKNRLIETKNKKNTDGEIKESIDRLVDIIEGRNMEKFETQLNENTQNIKQVDSKINKQETKVNDLNKKVKNQEIKITNINKNIDDINDKIEDIEEQIVEQDEKIVSFDSKTLYNVPLWCKDIKELLYTKEIKNNQKGNNYDGWILVAKRLNFTENDIKGWLNQVDPCMSMLQEWFIVNKTADAITGLLKCFKELNYSDCAKIIEDNLNKIEDENKTILNNDNNEELLKNAQVFISYEWSSKSQAELLKNHLQVALNENNQNSDKSINIWFDDGNMGGGSLRSQRIDRGLRVCSVLICLITGEASKDQNVLNQITLAIQLNKPIIPLLLDSKLKWPPAGSLGPILSEYLFIRFFQRPPKESTNDERYWPVDKFNELLMQIRQLVPSSISPSLAPSSNDSSVSHPEIFISYNWDKQKQIIKLYEKLTGMGLTCWLDIHQMGGGDSLYDKIDRGLRNCQVVISCITTKYSLSANCKKEVALANSIPKPMISILLEKDMKYPPAGPMGPIFSVLEYIDFTHDDLKEQETWDGESSRKLFEQLKEHLSEISLKKVQSKACVIS